MGDRTMEAWSLHMVGSALLRVGKRDDLTFEQRTELVKNPALIPNAVEELLLGRAADILDHLRCVAAEMPLDDLEDGEWVL